MVWGGGAYPTLSRSEDRIPVSCIWTLLKPQDKPWTMSLATLRSFPYRGPSNCAHLGPVEPSSSPGSTAVFLPLDSQLLGVRQCVSPASRKQKKQVPGTDASNKFAGLNLRRLDKNPLVTWEGAGEWEEFGKRQRKCVSGKLVFYKVNFSATAQARFCTLRDLSAYENPIKSGIAEKPAGAWGGVWWVLEGTLA